MSLRVNNEGDGAFNVGGRGLIIPSPSSSQQSKIQFPFHRENKVKVEQGGGGGGRVVNGSIPSPSPSSSSMAASAPPNPEQEALITKATYKKTRNLLNKLTPETFDQLTHLFLALPLGSHDERLANFVYVLFEKAVERPPSSPTYARMLHHICKSSTDPNESFKRFAQKIRHHCHKEFGESSVNKREIKELEQSLANSANSGVGVNFQQVKLMEEKKAESRRRALANMKFIGELYLMEMVTPKMIVARINSLLNIGKDEECLECLCVLLKAVGGALSRDLQELREAGGTGLLKSGSLEGEPFNPDPNWMDAVFHKLEGLLKDMKLSADLRYAMSNLFQLRKCGWNLSPQRQYKRSGTPGLAPPAQAPLQKIQPNDEVNHPTQISQSTTPPTKFAAAASSTSMSSVSGSKGETSSSGTTVRSSAVHNVNPTGLSTCEGVLDTEMKNAALTLQRLSQPGIELNLERKIEMLKYVRECAQTMESLVTLKNKGKSHAGTETQPVLKVKIEPPEEEDKKTELQNRVVQMGGGEPLEVYENHFQEPSPEPLITDNQIVPGAVPLEGGAASSNDAFREYLSCEDFEETLALIKRRFLGDQVQEFVDKLARQVCRTSKQLEQQLAANIVKFLIRIREIHKKIVIETMAQGVIQDLPRILRTSPKTPATSSLARFLVELFSEHTNLNWLVQLGDKLLQDPDGIPAWGLLVTNCLDALKSKKDERYVQISFNQTEMNHLIPIDGVPWLRYHPSDCLVDRLGKVLLNHRF